MIYLSRTYGSTAILICNALVMFMIYSWIKIKLKVLIFPMPTNVVVFLDKEWHVGGGPDVRPLVLLRVPDVQHRVPLLGDEARRLR
jgi:hypothetical protein